MNRRVHDRPERVDRPGRARPCVRYGGAAVSGLYATVNGAVTGQDTATVAVIDNTSRATLISCTINSTSSKNCSNTSGSGAAAPGDYIEVKLTTTGSSCANKRLRVIYEIPIE